MSRHHRLSALCALVILCLLTVSAPHAAVAAASAPAEAAATRPNCYAGTNFCSTGLFIRYWAEHGGLAQQGLPITPEFTEVNPTNGQTYRVQYFERARFEANVTPTTTEVRLGLLGREQFLARYPNGRPSSREGDVCFNETNRCVRGLFYQYWQSHGGLAQQGFPLSDEFDEVSAIDGKTYKVQYFERARFEYHPENAGTPYEVLLGLAGTEQIAARYPGGIPAQPLASGPASQAFYNTFITTNKALVVKRIDADVTGDGGRETLLLTIPNSCGSCHLFRLFIFSGETLIFTAYYNLVVENGLVPASDNRGFTMTEGIRRGNEGLCCVTGRFISTYRWEGWSFTLVDTTER